MSILRTKELKDGTVEFVDQTDDINDQIDEEIDKALKDMTGEEFEQKSFLSEKNKNVSLVQFAMQTEAITIEEPEEKEIEEQSESFADKVRGLFE